jgi:hypothetical protein
MQKTYNTLMIIFSAFLFSSLVYLVIGFALSRSSWKPVLESASVARIVFILFCVISVGAVALANKLKYAIPGDLPSLPDEQQLHRRIIGKSIVTFALSEIPAILGLVFILLSGNFGYLAVLCALSIVSFLLVKPSRDGFDDLEKRYQAGSR